MLHILLNFYFFSTARCLFLDSSETACPKQSNERSLFPPERCELNKVAIFRLLSFVILDFFLLQYQAERTNLILFLWPNSENCFPRAVFAQHDNEIISFTHQMVEIL